MDKQELRRIRGSIDVIRTEAGRILVALAEEEEAAETAPEAPESPPEASPAMPRATLTIGRAKAQAGAQASVGLHLTCPEPVAGIWLNIRHSPRSKPSSDGRSMGCNACAHSVSARPSQKNQRLHATFQSDIVCRLPVLRRSSAQT